MTPQVWSSNPQYKIEIGATTYTNDQGISLQITRPENNVDSLILLVNDYKSSKYIDVFDSFATITVSLRYGVDSWTKVFSGTTSTVSPKLSKQGEILEVSAWGKAKALIDTFCNTSYGVESPNPTIETPDEIWVDLVDNYINKSFKGANTGYAIGKTKIAAIHDDLTITNLQGPYLDNFTMVNRVCDLVTAHVGPTTASCHWFVDPDANLFINTIGNHENDASGWPTYWKSSQAASTIVVKQDMILYDFKNPDIAEYANKIVLLSSLRKPAYDYWAENQIALWGVGAGGTKVADNAVYKVGAYSHKITTDGSTAAYSTWYPSADNAAWDMTKIQSPDNVPSLNFYFRYHGLVTAIGARLNTSIAGGTYFTYLLTSDLPSADEWVHFSLPFGDYYNRKEKNNIKWIITGAATWNNINSIMFYIGTNVGQTPDFWVDDVHIAGKIIREAYDSTVIGTKNEYQKIVRNDTVADDNWKISGGVVDDSGMLAQMAKAELQRRKAIPITGIIQLPLMPDVLPGQLIHVHACQKSDGTYRRDQDFRIKEIVHNFQLPNPTTTLNLTSDLYNAHAKAAPTMASILQEYVGALKHTEAKDLRSSGVDPLVTRLTKDYPS